MVGQDKQKMNIGLSLKFEAKALKVVDYTRKNGRYWEYSEKAVGLIKEYKVSSFPTSTRESEMTRSSSRMRFLKSLDTWMSMAM